MSQDEVLIVESSTIDALTTTAITSGEVTTLAHELLNHSVESRALVVQGLATLAHALLTSAQSTEVLASPRNNIGSAENNYSSTIKSYITNLSTISILPAGRPPMLMSKKTTGQEAGTLLWLAAIVV